MQLLSRLLPHQAHRYDLLSVCCPLRGSRELHPNASADWKSISMRCLGHHWALSRKSRGTSKFSVTAMCAVLVSAGRAQTFPTAAWWSEKRMGSSPHSCLPFEHGSHAARTGCTDRTSGCNNGTKSPVYAASGNRPFSHDGNDSRDESSDPQSNGLTPCQWLCCPL